MNSQPSLQRSLLGFFLLCAFQMLSYAQHTELNIYGVVSSESKTPTKEYSPHRLQQLSMEHMQKGKPLQINLIYKDDTPTKMGCKEVLEYAARMWCDNLTVSEQTKGILNIEVCFSDKMPENLAYVATPFCSKTKEALVPDAVLFAMGEKTSSQLHDGVFGRIYINSKLNWFIEGSVNETISEQQYDLKTISLRAIGNVLGFASTVGASVSFKSREIIQGTILDRHILGLNGQSLFDQIDGKKREQLSDISGKDFFWTGDKALPLYNPKELSTESFMCFSDQVTGLFSGRIMKGQTEHSIDPNSLQVMWGIGWKQYSDNKVSIEAKEKNKGDILVYGSSCTLTYKTSSSLPISPIQWSVCYLGKDAQYHEICQSKSQNLTLPIQFDLSKASINSSGLYMVRVRLEGISQGLKISGDQIFYVSAAPAPIKVTFSEADRGTYFVSGILSIESLGAEEFQICVTDYEDGHKRKGLIKHLNYTSFRVHALRSDGYTEVKVKATNKFGSQEIEVPIIDSYTRSGHNEEKEREITIAQYISDESGCIEDIALSLMKGDWGREIQKSYQVQQQYVYEGEVVKTVLSEKKDVEPETFFYDAQLIYKLCPKEPDDIYVTLHLYKDGGIVVSSSPHSVRQDKVVTSLSSPVTGTLGFDIFLSSPSSLRIAFQDLARHQVRLYNLYGELLFSAPEVQKEVTIPLLTELSTTHYVLQIDNETIKL